KTGAVHGPVRIRAAIDAALDKAAEIVDRVVDLAAIDARLPSVQFPDIGEYQVEEFRIGHEEHPGDFAREIVIGVEIPEQGSVVSGVRLANGVPTAVLPAGQEFHALLL